MNIYLDDNITGDELTILLRKAGHTVVLPVDVGLSGVSDPRHLAFALKNGLVVLTCNHVDFDDLNELVRAAGGAHAGILVVRFDNDPVRDMKPKQIVSAIGKLLRANVPIANELNILNAWR